MNPDIVDARIRAFQSAKNLDDMATHAWALAIDLGESSPTTVIEVVYTARSSWILPMLAFARRDIPNRNLTALARFSETLFAAGALTDEIGLLPAELLEVAERETFAALHEFDELVTVRNYMDNFFRHDDKTPQILGLEYEVAHLSWLSAAYAQEQLKALPEHLRGPFEIHARHWHLIAAHGRQDDHDAP